MKNKGKWRVSNGSIYRRVTRETFAVGSTCLIVEDRVHLFHPEHSERVMRIAGTGIYYSMVPLHSDQHRLLCYDYCDEAMKMREPGFYRHALVMGCGGGAIPRWILEEYPSAAVDVVDYSSEMIRVCRKYFLNEWEKSRRLKYYCVNAKNFEPPDYRYQFLFCDMFDGTELAPFVYSRDFAKKMHRILSDEGILVINCGWGHLDEIRKIYGSEFANFQVIERKVWQTEVVKASDGTLWI